METIPYKGYSIHVNPRLISYVWVTKDGKQVCSASSVQGCQRQIDALAPNWNGCNCYVAALPHAEKFSIRCGAHELTCPAYRESRDPVDQANDRDIRAHYLIVTRIRKQS